MEDFFIFFLALIVIGTLIFMFIYTDSEFECALPKGGYFKIHWNKDRHKFNLFYWQPKKNANKVNPKDVLFIEGQPVEEKKPPAF